MDDGTMHEQADNEWTIDESDIWWIKAGNVYNGWWW